MIGRPFATAPDQHASIPITRRLARPDGSFGVRRGRGRLPVLVERSHVSPNRRPTRVDHRSPRRRIDPHAAKLFDADAISRSGASDPAWTAWSRTGLQPVANDENGIRLFRKLNAPLVVDFALAQRDLAAGQRSWLLWLPPLTVVPGLGVLGLGLLALRLRHGSEQIEAAAQDAERQRTRVMTILSHELRTPLSGVLGQAEMIADEGSLSDSQKERLTLLTEAGLLMRTTVDRVTDSTRMGGNFQSQASTPCDLDRLVRTCSGNVEVEARAKGLKLTESIDPSAPRRVMLARDYVQRILNNLLKNAVKFTVEGTVALRVMGDAKRLRFEVADTGPGIPPAKTTPPVQGKRPPRCPCSNSRFRAGPVDHERPCRCHGGNHRGTPITRAGEVRSGLSFQPRCRPISSPATSWKSRPGLLLPRRGNSASCSPTTLT